MLFNSFEFILFYVVVVAIYFAIAPQRRWLLLLVASYLFYMSWRAEYLVLIVASTLIDYVVALRLEKTRAVWQRRLWLTLSMCTNLGILFSFKYWNFFGDTFNALTNAIALDVQAPGLQVLLPVGISFYTFQSMSYTIDVYRGVTTPERHFGIFAVYVAFFPQLVAGPIERSHRLLPQFRQVRVVTADKVSSGLRLMLWGIIKKVVIADTVGQVVDTVYASPTTYSGPFLVLATVFFAVQIYCDFSGYSDVAIGCARVMGYDLMINFRRPYFATSVRDFWHRWHISLSTWFRDYVYIPIGGNRVGTLRRYFNLLAVFVVSGLWHGAGWTFVVWGALHGLYVCAEVALDGVFARLGRPLQRVPRLSRVAQSVWVCFLAIIAWVFFRADSMGDAWYIFGHLHVVGDTRLATLWGLGLPRFEMMMSFVSIIVLIAVDWRLEAQPAMFARAWRHRPVRWAAYLVGTYAVIFFGVLGRTEFIYFQF